MNKNNLGMFLGRGVGLDTLPRDIIIEIALFEGRILRAYLRDYVCQLYARVYKNYFGYKFTLKAICGGVTDPNNKFDRMSAPPFYTAWSTMWRRRHPECVKQRIPRSHMRPYVGIVPQTRLVEERKRIEKRLERFFKPQTETFQGDDLLLRPVRDWEKRGGQ